MSEAVVIAGVGMIPFSKPGKSQTYVQMGEQAARAAIEDAGLAYADMGQAYASYVYGDSTSGQTALKSLGLTGVPVFNVNNNCGSGSSALFLARQAVASGVVDCALALGFEQMAPGALTSAYNDRPAPTQHYFEKLFTVASYDFNAPATPQLFSAAASEYISRHGTRTETLALIAQKSRRHAMNNPYAVFREPITVQQVLESAPVHGVLTRLHCCPPTCGAAAVVVCSAGFAKSRGLGSLVSIAAQSLVGDSPVSFEDASIIKLVGYQLTQRACRAAYEQAGVRPADIDVVELHDCFTINELLTYEALGLVPEGEGEKFIVDGDNTYGGRVVTNPSGGLLSKGHPLGATGLAQITELVWQLRGQAGRRQVERVRWALQHNAGLNGGCFVTLLQAAH